MKKTWNIHWVAPSSMLIAFLCGILLAIGHHLFYRSLAGTPASVTSFEAFGLEISPQQINVAIGTAFALLSKTAFLMAVSIVYVQGFWAVATNHRKRIVLAHVDALFDAMSDLTVFFKVRLWSHQPLPLFIALVAWLLPVASIVSPAMLSVEVAPVLPIPTAMQHVPTLDFNSLNYMAPMWMGSVYPRRNGTESPSIEWTYNGPHIEVERIVANVAPRGAILAVDPPADNATWEVQFHGPSLACENQDSQFRRIAQCMLFSAMNVDLLYTSFSRIATPNSHIPSDQSSRPGLTFQNRATDSADFYLIVRPKGTLDSFYDAMLDFPMANFERANQSCAGYLYGGQNLSRKVEEQFDSFDGLYLKCQLYNASYNVAFDYTNQARTVIWEVTQHNSVRRPSSAWNIFMRPFFKLRHVLHFNWFRKVLQKHRLDIETPRVRQQSYIAVFDAFQSLLSGRYWPEIGDRGLASRKPLIFNTVLMDSPELQTLGHYLGRENLQKVLTLSDDEIAQSIQSPYPRPAGKPLARAIEELFQNITVSLMSSPFLRANTSTSFAPPPSKVMSHRYHAIYTYSANKLWLAYGLEIFFTLVVILLGAHLFRINGASFGSSFSNILRSSQNAQLDTKIQNCDKNGTDPLPEYLASTAILLAGTEKHEQTELLSNFTADSYPSDPRRSKKRATM